MAERWDNVVPIRGEKGEAAVGLKSGGGDGTSGGMEARVKALEDKFEKIDAKLDGLVKDVSYMKGKFESAPTASAFGELKGRVDSLPTTAKLGTMLGLAVAAIAILNNWSAIKAALLG